ncbi:MAG: GHKL domain-containing protein [Lachnospiraceae bacterium]|nr:GHKL domain-containing protein [Butyrivibrio sp.]MCM1344542.1 GHKL domain-containing protein [Muribaculaceae bacterium]MCM1411850.1 GHKL domain-containing protein [Lachnospiraceae bacterium]
MDRVNKKALFVESLFLAAVLFLEWKMEIRSLVFAMRLCGFLILAAVLKSMPFLGLSVNDMAAVVFCMVFNRVVIQYACLILNSDMVPFLLLLSLELLVLVRGIHRRKRGYGIAIGYAVSCCLGVLLAYQKWKDLILAPYYEREGDFGFAVKALYLLLCMALFSGLVFLAIRCLNALAGRWMAKLQEYSMAYGEIDRSVMLVTILTLGALSMKGLMWRLWPFFPNEGVLLGSPYDPPQLTLALCAILIVTQIIYIRLLVKSISVKEEMRLQEKDLLQLAEYNHELEQNMEDMRAIRHDIRNMFLTMGGFVDRSSDAEMKAFYGENIVPFAERELQKSDLYAKLSCIHSEGLKSFLYFKVMQGIEQDVPMDLEIQFADAGGISCIGQADLIRILGILLDNAVEEAKLCNGRVGISMREKEREYLFMVSNTVRRQIREKGVAAGITDKGPGRGNGLLILDRLAGKYGNVLLNSFFREEEFVQCLRVGK